VDELILPVQALFLFFYFSYIFTADCMDDN